MDCNLTRLQDCLYGFLEGPEELGVRGHLDACARCRADLERLVTEKKVLARAALRPARRGRAAATLVPLGFAAAFLAGLVWLLASPAPQKTGILPAAAPAQSDDAGSLRAQIAKLEKVLADTTDEDQRRRIESSLDDLRRRLSRAPEGKTAKTPDEPKPKEKGPNRIDDLTAQIAKRPNDAKLHLDRAEALLKTKQWEAALADANKAIALDPENARAHLLAATALHYLGRAGEGDQAHARAIALDPSLKKSDGDLREARVRKELEALYGKMKMTKDPDERATLEMKAKELGQELKLLSQGGKEEVNFKEVEMKLRENPDNVEALLERARGYIDMGKGEPALQDLSRAIKLKPAHAPAFLARAVAHALAGDIDRAWQDHKQGAELDPAAAKEIAAAAGTIKKLMQAQKDRSRPAEDVSRQVETLRERVDELKAMAADADLPAADRERARLEAERVQSEIEKLKSGRRVPPPPAEKKK